MVDVNMNFIFQFYLAVILIGCSPKDKHDAINLFINPKNHGWYFIELIKDSSIIIEPQIVDVKIENTNEINKIKIRDYNKTSFKVFDSLKTEVSSTMKLAGILTYYNGKNYFEFYNPSDQELSEIKNWLPTDPNYQKIVDASKNQLEKLIRK